MAVNVYILRHGRTANNLNGITQDVNDDIGLAEEAYAELNDNRAKLLQTIGEKNCKVLLITSTMLRALQTTAKLAEMLTLANVQFSVRYDERMHEVDFGKFGGLPDNARVNGFDMSYYRNLTATFYRNKGCAGMFFPGGESLAAIRTRVIKCIVDIYKICKAASKDELDCNVVIVGHNRWFRHFLAEIDDNYRQDMFAKKLPHGQLVSIDIDKLKKTYNRYAKAY